jgi:ribulose 1,5-bisphosphate carboxylase large subunit-like protein
MGSNRRFSYVDQKEHRRLNGEILNISQESATKGLVKFAFPDSSFEDHDIPTLLNYLLYSSIQGATSKLRLVDLDLSPSFLASFRGPSLGTLGIQKMLGVTGRPMFGVILKPRQGLTASLARDVALAAVKGGADYVIDDEVMVNQLGCQIEDRIHAISTALRKVAEKRRRVALYIVNLTGDYDKSMQWLKYVREHDTAECRLGIMLNGITMGFPLLLKISDEVRDIPVIANTVGCGMIVLSPGFNISEHILVELSRICGADAVYAIRHSTEFRYDPSKIDTILRHLKRPLGHIGESMPIYAGAISLRTFLRHELPKTTDFMLQAGSTVCAFERRGLAFPQTIEFAASVLSHVLKEIYVEQRPVSVIEGDLLKKYPDHNYEALRAMGYDKQ